MIIGRRDREAFRAAIDRAEELEESSIEMEEEAAAKTILVEDLTRELAESERVSALRLRKLKALRARRGEIHQKYTDEMDRLRDQHRDQLEALTKIIDRVVDSTAPKGVSSMVIQEPSAEVPEDAIGSHHQMMSRINDIFGDGLSVDEMVRRRDASVRSERDRLRAELETLR